MNRKGRDQLKELFSKGKLPTESSFQILIDSMYNREDDDFDDLYDGPLKLYVKTEKRKRSEAETLLEFYNDLANTGEDGKATWRFSLSPEGALKIFRDGDKEVIVIDAEGNIELVSEELKISGNVSLSGFKGSYTSNNELGKPLPDPLADGEWHPIVEGVNGCQMFKVVAGVGYPGGSKFALAHAIATLVPKRKYFWNIPRFNPRHSRIQIVQSCGGSLKEKLDLKWATAGDNHNLLVRSRTNYGAKTTIQCHITKLWFDPTMSENIEIDT